VTLPAQLWSDLGLPGSVSAGEEVSGVSIVGRRSLVAVVPDADTATSGCPYAIGAEYVVPVNTAPEVTSASITTGKGKPRPGDLLAFSATGTDADGDALQYHWDFGDGSSGTGALVEHAYTSAGTYTAVVTVSDGTDTATGSVVVTLKGRTAR
jgi:chitodextrinase